MVYTIKIRKIRTPETIAVIFHKFEQCGFTIMCLEFADADGMANNVDPEQEQSDLGLHYLPRPVCRKTYDTGDSRYVDFTYLDTITYVEVIFHPQLFFSIYLCISSPSMSKTVNMKQRVSRGDFSCPRHIFYYIYLLLPMSK